MRRPTPIPNNVAPLTEFHSVRQVDRAMRSIRRQIKRLARRGQNTVRLQEYLRQLQGSVMTITTYGAPKMGTVNFYRPAPGDRFFDRDPASGAYTEVYR